MKQLGLVCLALILSACGGDGSTLSDNGGISYKGNTTPAAISADNAEEIGSAAGESVFNAATSEGSAPLAIDIKNASVIDLAEINLLIIESAKLSMLPSALILEDKCSSGSVSVNEPSHETGPVTLNFVYNACRMTYTTITSTGRVRFHYNNYSDHSAGYSITFSNFRISQPGRPTITLNMHVECANTSSCVYSSDFVGSDGRIHRISSFSVSGTASTGYIGSAIFYHGRWGRVSISFNSLTYGNCRSVPDGGSLVFSSTNGSSGTIEFESDCTRSGTWTNGSVSGSFF